MLDPLYTWVLSATAKVRPLHLRCILKVRDATSVSSVPHPVLQAHETTSTTMSSEWMCLWTGGFPKWIDGSLFSPTLTERLYLGSLPMSGGRRSKMQQKLNTAAAISAVAGDGEDARRKAIMNVVQMWLDRLQLISVIVSDTV